MKRWELNRMYNDMGERMLEGVDLTPPFPSSERLETLLAANFLLRFLPHDRNAWNLEGLLP